MSDAAPRQSGAAGDHCDIEDVLVDSERAAQRDPAGTSRHPRDNGRHLDPRAQRRVPPSFAMASTPHSSSTETDWPSPMRTRRHGTVPVSVAATSSIGGEQVLSRWPGRALPRTPSSGVARRRRRCPRSSSSRFLRCDQLDVGHRSTFQHDYSVRFQLRETGPKRLRNSSMRCLDAVLRPDRTGFRSGTGVGPQRFSDAEARPAVARAQVVADRRGSLASRGGEHGRLTDAARARQQWGSGVGCEDRRMQRHPAAPAGPP